MTVASNKLFNGDLDKPTLLFVDDERRVLSSMRAMFRREYHVFVADSGLEALEIIDREGVDVVISDQRMPRMTGVELLCAVREKAPSVMRILLTGYADLEAIEASINEGEVFRYLMKPCPPDDLRKAIAMAVEAVRTAPPAIEEIELEVPDQPPAELIPFPTARRQRRPTATIHRLPAARQANVRSDRPSKLDRQEAPQVDVLVLSRDKTLHQTIAEAVPDRNVFKAASVDQALGVLAEQRVGVMITDLTADSLELESLTKTLKAEVPELVTIIASERSDAHTLISLINEGQIFRFLLKPVARGQCRLWVTSAIRKFGELATTDGAIARHRVAVSDVRQSTGLLDRVRSGLQRLRGRLRSPAQHD